MEVDINKIKRKLLVKYPFFGSIVVNLNYIEDKDCITLGTDGENVYYNSEFLKNLTEDEQTFLFAHEICHVAFNHIYRSEGKNKKIWNIAADGVINAFLEKDGLPLVKGAVNIPNAINYNVEELYEKLLKEEKNKIMLFGINKSKTTCQNDRKEGTNRLEDFKEQAREKSKSNENNGKNSNEGNRSKKKQKQQEQNNITQKVGNAKTLEIKDFSRRDYNDIDEEIEDNNIRNFENNSEQIENDIHSMWDKAIEKRKQAEKLENMGEKVQKENVKKEMQEDISERQNSAKLDERMGQEIKDKIRKITDMEEIDAFVKNKNQRKENLEELRKELLKKSIGNTKATTSVKRRVLELGQAKALLDWKYLLREAVNLDADWSYKNASIENGVVVPHLEEIVKPETEILLDTSGSVSEILLRNFLKECKNIFKQSKVKVGCFDTKFYGFNEIRTEEDINNMQFIGHGLTNFFSAVNAFSRQVENKIIFTDGRGYIPENSGNIIWVIFGDEKINVSSGKVIYITNEQLRALYNEKAS